MRIPRPTAALVVAFTLAGSVGAAPLANRAPEAAPAPSAELQDRLARAELLAGITDVSGPGLLVTLRHSPFSVKQVDPKRQKKVIPDNLLIHDYDLSAVLNELRAAGAEALAVSGARQEVAERILATSAVIGTEDGVQINGTRLTPPYRILAVGGSDVMRTQLFRPGGMVKKFGLDALQMIELENVTELVIPACRKTPEPKFARVTGRGASPMSPTLASEASLVEMLRTAAAAPPASAQAAPIPARATDTSATGPANQVIGVQPRVKMPVAREAVKPPVRPEPLVAKTPEKEPAQERTPRTVAKTPPATPAASPMPAADLGLFGGKGLAKYHAAGCRFGERIEKGERVLFNSAEAARQAGRVPCSICLPGSAERSSAH